MAVVLPPPGAQPPVVGAPPMPSAALRAWVAQHYAPKLRAGVLMGLARNPSRAQQLLHPGLATVVHGPAGPPTVALGKPIVTPGLAGPPPVANPYSAYPDYAQQALKQMDADRLAAQGQATTTAAWLAPAMQGLQQGQQQAQSAYTTALAGLYGNQAGVGPAQVSASSPGGIVSSGSNFAVGAGKQAAAAGGVASQQMGAVQALLGNQKIGDLGAGALGNLAYQAAQIPTVFAAKKNEYLGKLSAAMADAQAQASSDAAALTEKQREFAIQNATTLRGQDIGLARTTIGTTGKAGAAAGLKPSSSALPLASGQAPPAGYQTYTEPSTGQTYAIKAPKPPGAGKVPTGSGGYFLPGPKQNVPGTTPHRVPGGWRYLPDKGASAAAGSAGYQKLMATWGKEANKRLQGKRSQVGSTSHVNAQGDTVTTPRYQVTGAQHPESVFAQMLVAGLRPADAYRLVNANIPSNGAPLDEIDVYNALGPSLGEKRARQVTLSLTGKDPVATAAGGWQ